MGRVWDLCFAWLQGGAGNLLMTIQRWEEAGQEKIDGAIDRA
jgi:hypothetical protein